jgi:broad specificity phosphatase PhoE
MKTLKKQLQTSKTKKSNNDYFEVIFVRHAETQPNVEHRMYDNFGKDEYYPITKNGERQAKQTGKYFKNKFGANPFDLVISSHRHRCIQTAEGIISQCGYKGKILKDKRVLEEAAGVFNGMNRNEQKELKNSNPKYKEWDDKYNELIQKQSETNNEFEKYKLVKEIDYHYYNIGSKLFKYQTLEYMTKEQLSFLKDLKKKNAKRILVVMHGAAMWRLFQNIQPNIDLQLFNWVYDMDSYKKEKNCVMFSAVCDKGVYKVITNLHTKQFL